MKPREFSKVKRVNKGVTILWSSPNGQHREEGSLKDCPDTPNGDFLDQMATVEADIVGKIGFGAEFARSFTLTGITLSRNNNGRREFTPSATMDFGWGVKGFSIPTLLEPDDEAGSSSKVLTASELSNMEELFNQAALYVDGNRHQAGLPLDPSKIEAGDDEGEKPAAEEEPVGQEEEAEEERKLTAVS